VTSIDREPITLREGRIYWPSDELSAPRYGCIFLTRPDGTYIVFGDELDGTYGELIAEVLEVQEVGTYYEYRLDLTSTEPEVGDKHTLGHGVLWTAPDYDLFMPVIGLDPKDGTETYWLDPAQLYSVVGQVVRLLFVPDETGE
jgi:hypothetical protein